MSVAPLRKTRLTKSYGSVRTTRAPVCVSLLRFFKLPTDTSSQKQPPTASKKPSKTRHLLLPRNAMKHSELSGSTRPLFALRLFVLLQFARPPYVPLLRLAPSALLPRRRLLSMSNSRHHLQSGRRSTSSSLPHLSHRNERLSISSSKRRPHPLHLSTRRPLSSRNVTATPIATSRPRSAPLKPNSVLYVTSAATCS